LAQRLAAMTSLASPKGRNRFDSRPKKNTTLDKEFSSQISKLSGKEPSVFDCFRCCLEKNSKSMYVWSTSQGDKNICNGCHGNLLSLRPKPEGSVKRKSEDPSGPPKDANKSKPSEPPAASQDSKKPKQSEPPAASQDSKKVKLSEPPAASQVSKKSKPSEPPAASQGAKAKLDLLKQLESAPQDVLNGEARRLFEALCENLRKEAEKTQTTDQPKEEKSNKADKKKKEKKEGGKKKKG